MAVRLHFSVISCDTDYSANRKYTDGIHSGLNDGFTDV